MLFTSDQDPLVSVPKISSDDDSDEKRVVAPLTKDLAMDALTLVFDPELVIDIVTLGLVYGVEILPENAVKVRMTMTTAGCPFAGQLVASVKETLLEAGASRVEVEVVFDPPWKPSAELRAVMGA